MEGGAGGEPVPFGFRRLRAAGFHRSLPPCPRALVSLASGGALCRAGAGCPGRGIGLEKGREKGATSSAEKRSFRRPKSLFRPFGCRKAALSCPLSVPGSGRPGQGFDDSETVFAGRRRRPLLAPSWAEAVSPAAVLGDGSRGGPRALLAASLAAADAERFNKRLARCHPSAACSGHRAGPLPAPRRSPESAPGSESPAEPSPSARAAVRASRRVFQGTASRRRRHPSRPEPATRTTWSLDRFNRLDPVLVVTCAVRAIGPPSWPATPPPVQPTPSLVTGPAPLL